jgi:hypothetical protein
VPHPQLFSGSAPATVGRWRLATIRRWRLAPWSAANARPAAA